MPAEVYSIPAIWKGTLVRRRGHAEIYRVKKLNSKSVTVTDAAGKEWKLTTPSQSAWNAIEPLDDDSPEAQAFRENEFTSTVAFRVGNVVRWPGAKHPLGQGLLVVTKVNADGDCNLSPLGGNLTGEFFRSVPAANLEKVEGEVSVANA